MNDNQLSPLPMRSNELSAQHRQVLEWMLAGENIQIDWSPTDGWLDIQYSSIYANLHREPNVKYRLKPKTIKIGDIEVPEPCRVAPKEDAPYYMPDMGYNELVFCSSWQNDRHDIERLKTGCLHLSKESAIQHAKALILVSGGKV